MSGDQPTKRHLRTLRQRGVVPRSTLANATVSILTLTATLAVAAPLIWDHFQELTRALFTTAGELSDPTQATEALQLGVEAALWITVPIVLIVTLVTALGIVLQVGPGWTPQALIPRLERFAPKMRSAPSGRRFSSAFFTFIFGFILMFSGVYVVWGVLFESARVTQPTIEGTLHRMVGHVVEGGLLALGVLVLFGIVDVVIRRGWWRQDVAMTPADRQREAREQGFASVVRRHLRSRRGGRQAGIERAAEATLWISDADQLAVGLLFDRRSGQRPRLVSVARGAAAATALDAARALGVSVHVDPELSRALSHLTEDAPIPKALFAEMAFVLRRTGSEQE